MRRGDAQSSWYAMKAMREITLSEQELEAIGRHVILQESDAVRGLAEQVDSHFSRAVRVLFQMEGRLIVTGIGKSALIAQKIVATMNSTGTPAVFMHAADAIHGDLGIIQKGDVVLCLSKSGMTPEIKVLVPLIRLQGNLLIGMVSQVESYLAEHSDIVLQATVSQEACPNNLAPTSSTTAQLVMGDALAVCLLKLRGFTPQDFARYHPGGALGKRLYMRVDDIIDRSIHPSVAPRDGLEKVIISISANRLGATAVLGPEGTLRGIITDGDLRRMLQKTHSLEGTCAQDIMSSKPKIIAPDALAINAFEMMEKNKITQLLVMENGQYVGMVHIHDLLREGVVG